MRQGIQGWTERWRQRSGPLWTDQQTTIAAVVIAVGAAVLSVSGTGQLRWVWLTALGVAAACGILTSGFGGAICGLITGAVAVFVLQAEGLWEERAFTAVVLIWPLVVLTGSLTGMAATQSRIAESAKAQGRRGDPRGARPAAGSLGLIDADTAVVRLEEERLRAQAHLRDLSAIGIQITSAREIPQEHARALRRAVARLIETMLSPSAVPFAWSDNEFGAILPEVDEDAAWSYVGPLFSAIENATFTVRDAEGSAQRHQVSTFADIEAAVTTLDLDLDDATQLLQRARPQGLAGAPS